MMIMKTTTSFATTVAAIALLSMSLFSASQTSHAANAADKESPTAAATVPTKVAATKAALRDLWVGHIFWVREVVAHLSAKDGSAAAIAEQEVVANAKQIAGAIEPFYGKPAADRLFKLLAGHYAAVKAHAQATLASDSTSAKKATDDLVANAREIAKFLSDANPHLPEATLLSLLSAHGGHHVQQNQQFAARKFAEEARTWEAMKNHLYTVADALGDALAKQFPQKF